MKKIVIFLILFVACQAFAQKSSRAFFDFTHPQQLNPSITPGENSGDVVLVTDKRFSDGKINVSFSDGNQLTGVQILTDGLTKPGQTVYFLRVTATASIKFSSIDGAVIDSIQFSDETDPGDLYLDNGQGTYDPFRGYKFWTANNKKDVTSVSFTNSYRTPRIEQVAVYYTEPSDVLVPVSSDIYNGQTLSSFQELNLTFSDNMSILNTEGLKFSDADKSISRNMAVSVDGRNVKLLLDSPVETDGTYTITIPARSFRNGNGYENKALTYTFNVATPKNIFNYVSVSPEPGEVEKLSTGIFVLTYSKPLSIVDNTQIIYLKYNGGNYARTTISKNLNNSKEAILDFGIPEGMTDKGVYTIDIPENVISDQVGEIYNPAFTLTYTIGSDPEPPTPVETETMKKANELLQMTGVGYPKSTSKAYTALAALVGNKVSDEELQPAIDAMYAETDVEMPVTGKYYNIAGVNKEGKKLYIVYDKELSLSTDIAKATAFEADVTEGRVVMKTIDGKYLTPADITTDESLKYLALEKMLFEETADYELFGCLYIKGDIKNSTGKIFTVPALINYDDNSVGTDATEKDLYFDATFSSAFMITETTKPSEDIAIDAEYTITPDAVESSKDVLTLTFTKPSSVTLADVSRAYFANASGGVIENADIYAVSGTENQFTISFGNLPAGDYSIVLPEGTFTCVDNGVTKEISAISKKFKIGDAGGTGGTGGSGDDEGFSYTYSSFFLYKFQNIANPVKDVELNEIYLYIYPGLYTDMIPDPSKKVKIVRYYNITDVIREGHFVRTEIPEFPGYPAIKLILDEPIKAGEMKKDTYCLFIDPGTYGDANFGKYLQDKNSVKASECKVNPVIKYPIDVDNNFVSGIFDVNISGTPANTVIYDLTGRRVQSMSKAGVYIVNGRKVVVGK